ncbi:MAG: methionyl-tRNA formyltransferase [Paludibacteraceae bacterium]|nr:methionyl-tRNA formyltransferase [Paludibacteraceae bacterium]
MTKSDLRIVYLGTPEFAVAGLRTLVENGYNVVAVVTMPDKPAGRGHQMQYSDVKKYALEVGLPVLQPEKLKDEAFIEELRSYKADLQIVTAFRMLPEVVWTMPRLGTFNVHGSLLPQYRGAAPINWAVMNGDTETGLTTFMLKHEIDTGNMILQERIPIGPDENVGSVHDRLMELSKSIVLRTVDLIIDCENQGIPVPTTPQPEIAELRPAPKIFKEDCEIKFDQKTATEVHNFVRGLSPYPAAWANLNINGQYFENVKIYAVETMDKGQWTKDKSSIVIPCKEGAVRILELQVPGKKRMDIKSFLNGLH